MWQFEAGRRRGDVSGEYVERDGRVVVVGTYLIVVVLPSRSSLRAPSNLAVAIIASTIYVLSIRFRSVQFNIFHHKPTCVTVAVTVFLEMVKHPQPRRCVRQETIPLKKRTWLQARPTISQSHSPFATRNPHSSSTAAA